MKPNSNLFRKMKTRTLIPFAAVTAAVVFIAAQSPKASACDSANTREMAADFSPAALVASVESVQSNYLAVFLLAEAAGSNTMDPKVATEIAKQYHDITQKSNLALKFIVEKGCLGEDKVQKLKQMITINKEVDMAAEHVQKFLETKDAKEGQEADKALGEALALLQATFPKSLAAAGSQSRG